MVGDTLAIGLDPGPGHVLRPHITDMGLATAFASHVPRYFNQRQKRGGELWSFIDNYNSV